MAAMKDGTVSIGQPNATYYRHSDLIISESVCSMRPIKVSPAGFSGWDKKNRPRHRLARAAGYESYRGLEE
jgi:hypothetical protein